MVDQTQEINKKAAWELATNAPDNSSDELRLPLEMTFNEGHVVSIVTYSILMVIAAVGNITVLVILLKRRRSIRSRINTMVMHLAIADLMVSIVIPPTWKFHRSRYLGVLVSGHVPPDASRDRLGFYGILEGRRCPLSHYGLLSNIRLVPLQLRSHLH